jgi:monoterpene epsilon-lactone hydrolase
MLRDIHEQAVGSDIVPTVEEQRAAMDGFRELATLPTDVEVVEVDAGGVRAEWITPHRADTDRVLMYVHGGGYVIGSMETHTRLVGHLAKSAGCRALNLDYRLAPEHPHPAAVEDGVAAYRWLLDRGTESANIVIGGDSAGGGLTVAIALKLRDEGLPQPAGLVPISPWIDLEATGASMESKAEVDLLVDRDSLKLMTDMFLAGQDANDPLAAPLHADLTGLAPMYIQVGGDETLLDDSTRLAANAATAGLDVRLDCFPEMQHVFQMAVGNVPEADDAVARAASWMSDHMGRRAS